MVIGKEGRSNNFNFRNRKVSSKQNKIVFNSRYAVVPGNTGGVLEKITNLMHKFTK